jgi:PAS domain S-box-containing protein
MIEVRARMHAITRGRARTWLRLAFAPAAAWCVDSRAASIATGSAEGWLIAAILLAGFVVLLLRGAVLRRQLTAAAGRFALLESRFRDQTPVRDPLESMSIEVNRYRKAVEALRARRQQELVGRVQAEVGLQQIEERYGLAIRGVDDALWEWNLRTDRAYFSTRWKSMLGYADHELSDRIDEWTERIHPNDQESFMEALKRHLEGGTARLEHEHRLRHHDGAWRWVAARASLVRDAAGEPSRIVGLLSDITPRKRIEEIVIEIAEGLSAASGDESLRKLVRSFAAVLGVREAFVCECSDYPTTHVRMLARWKAGDYARCVEFDLTGTACEDVICEGRTVFVARDADTIWPLEGQYERRSYLGLPCLDSSGRVIGHIACADDKPMREELPHHAILKIFSMRAAIELERTALERSRASMTAAAGLYPDRAGADGGGPPCA